MWCTNSTNLLYTYTHTILLFYSVHCWSVKASFMGAEDTISKNGLHRWAALHEQVMYSELEDGKRTRGGQRKCYKGTLRHSVKQCFIRTKTWEKLATDRKLWRTSTHKGVEISEKNRRSKRELKRVAHKTSQTSTPVAEDRYPCPLFDKICHSQIGLTSKLRVH